VATIVKSSPDSSGPRCAGTPLLMYRAHRSRMAVLGTNKPMVPLTIRRPPVILASACWVLIS